MKKLGLPFTEMETFVETQVCGMENNQRFTLQYTGLRYLLRHSIGSTGQAWESIGEREGPDWTSAFETHQNTFKAMRLDEFTLNESRLKKRGGVKFLGPHTVGGHEFHQKRLRKNSQ